MYNIKVREAGTSPWELSTVANGVKHKTQNMVAYSNRTMDDIGHEAKTSEKVVLTLTFNRGLDENFTKQILNAFSHQYVEVEYYEPSIGAYAIKEFTISDRDIEITAWNDSYKRFNPISITLEER